MKHVGHRPPPSSVQKRRTERPTNLRFASPKRKGEPSLKRKKRGAALSSQTKASPPILPTSFSFLFFSPRGNKNPTLRLLSHLPPSSSHLKPPPPLFC